MNLSEQRQCSNQSQQGRLLICPEPLPFRVGGFIKCIFYPRDTIFNPCPKCHFSNQDLSWNFFSARDTSGRAFPGDLSVPRPLGTSIYLFIKQGQYLISGKTVPLQLSNCRKTSYTSWRNAFKVHFGVLALCFCHLAPFKERVH